MKKILLTTTALTLIAGAAAAEISLSGSGRIGVVNTNTQAVAAVLATTVTTAQDTALLALGSATPAVSDTYATALAAVNTDLGTDAANATALDNANALMDTATTAGLQTAAQTAIDAANTAISDKAAAMAIIDANKGSALVAATNTTATTHRFRVNINASGETDGGLTFGAYVRLNMNGGAVGAIGAPRLWIGNGTATLTIGNASGAVAQNGNIWGCSVGFTGNCNDMASNQWSWASHSSGGAGNNVIRVDFALGSANVSVSGGNGNDTEVAASFALGAAKVGVSYDNGTGGAGGTQLGVSFDAGSANIGVHLARTDLGVTGATATVSYGIGGGTLYVFGGNQIAGGAQRNVYGVSYSQSLGGGATVAVSTRSVGGNVTTDAGVKFKF
ncbi:MAG: porin [Alphaproteobacteria bacterium]|nr:porin [Alphaproteobacteria bacterium]